MENKTVENIHPTFDKLIQRSEKESRLQQHAKVFWFTGFSGSGKTTLAVALERKLFEAGYLTQVLDGDNIRTGLNNNLGFSKDDRAENIRRIAEASKLLLNCGIITLNCFVSPMIEMRDQAKEIIGGTDFLEIYISTSLEICEERDVKGLYKKARAGEIKDFTGIDAPFEAPKNPALEINTGELSFEESLDKLYNFAISKIKYS